ncbi:uncharacterized protein DFL_002295 [Arthrobotrys flagrans]|uniref:Uncharacterized protein n=1 Tax=Arthrobotrys flagrans TaxID=97331 RepID=A0A437AAH9_ARTFL|nr:hypothetical protein DFL_002295 [Arthrobotrys flagrans]
MLSDIPQRGCSQTDSKQRGISRPLLEEYEMRGPEISKPYFPSDYFTSSGIVGDSERPTEDDDERLTVLREKRIL